MLDDKVRVLVVAGYEPLRKGLASTVARAPDLAVVGAFPSAEDALAEFDTLGIDVVILEDRPPGMGGAAACREFIRRQPRAGILVLATDLGDEMLLHACLFAGARGYLAKECGEMDLVRAIRALGEGESVLAGEVIGRVVAWARHSQALNGVQSLTASEMRFLSLAAQGSTNRQIAQQARVSEGTVKLHLRKAMRKLGVADRSQAVAAGIRRGII